MDGIVLSWTIEDICNEDLYKDEVKKIPDEFHSVGEYLESYTLPLIEETRAELFSCLEMISEAPSAEVQQIDLRHTKKGMVCTMDILADGFSGGVDMYEPRKGDILILSSLKPESIDDLLRYGVTYCLAIVKNVQKLDVKKKNVQKIKLADGAESETEIYQFTMSVPPLVTSPDQMDQCSNVLYLTSTVTNSRIWKALQNYDVHQNLTLLKKILSRNQMDKNVFGSTYELNNPEKARVLEQLLSMNLNQSQLEAVKSTISAVQGNKLSSVELVWGPPGTGKTKTVGSILWSLKQLKIRTLTCAPTNVAVVGVCSRLVHLLKYFDGKNSGSEDPPVCLADVVLFGNRGKMDIVGDIEDVFLDHRISQLYNCLLSDTNWRFGVVSMIRFLEDCTSMYDIYVEQHEGDQKICLGFGDYLREQYKELEDNLNHYFRTLFIHIPRRFLTSEFSTRIISLQNILRVLRGMLSSSVITENQLKLAFGTPPASILPGQTELMVAREECLKKLRNLQQEMLDLGDFGSIRDFCLENAILVFCTASSSFLLHDVYTAHFEVVVIDEAAQLKECESVIPLRLNQVKHALLVGDECQLPALVHSKASKRAGFGKSLFERLVSLQHGKHLLDIQYRMHPSISLFPSNRFYDGKILDGPNVLDDGYNKKYLHCIFGSYAFVDIVDGREETDDVGKSMRNWVEVAVVVHLIKSLYESWKSMKGNISIGVISPYAAQVKSIKDKICRKYDNIVGFEIRVKSIDGFQGQEDDIIILSMVRCNTKGNVGFLYDNRRTNVAITRARHCLWIVGSAATLSRSMTVWSDIVFDAKQRGCLFDAKGVDGMANLILNVKNQLDQLVDLMNPNSSLFSSKRWKVFFSDEFLRSFTRLNSKSTRMNIIQMLLRLADGWRSRRRNLSIANHYLARVYAVEDHYIVWSIDLQKDQQSCTQIIKLWNLVPRVDIEGLPKRLDHIFSMYTDAYMERCKTIFLEGTVEVPMMWTDRQELAQYKRNDQYEIKGEDRDLSDSNFCFLEDSKVNESLVLMRFYALSSGVVKHLLLARDGSEIDIPFELNDQEMDIIRFPDSSFILGRSGTGKTTVLTTKLVRMEQQFFVSSHGINSSKDSSSVVAESSSETGQMVGNVIEGCFIKQVFLTVSPKLCSAIRGQVNRLVRFVNFGELSGPIDSVTMHDTINKLDEFTDIPDNFNDLTQDQYPLIITFWKFLMMLDGTIESSYFNKFFSDWGASVKQGVSKSRTIQALMQSKEVDFDKFCSSYWPHFNEKLTKNLDASTVFTQIITHIKGELSSVGSVIGREHYVALSERRFSSLSSAARERIYDIFLDYEKRKCFAREFDLSDFVNNLYSRLSNGPLSFKVDFIYIDEVQDLTITQIVLLKYICNNFKEGFVFAGDTAQTIARGVDFRFEDIRSLFYKEFLSELKEKEKKNHLSDTFQLCQNFRTHIGVLRLSQSVLDLLYYFFPFSLDNLNPETSLIYGDAPVLLESDGDENAITKIFGGSENTSGRSNEFGAEQVILVRNDSTKKEIMEIVGKRALVLTIIDCKGLEFQDVLMYNFFGSSPLANKWRVLYGYLENEEIFDPSMTRSYPRFDISCHYLLCSELKQLYVAITRTRQRLWICENSKEFCKPMFDYWKRLCLVQGTQLDTDFIETMRAVSTPNDWRIRGIKLFNERQFEMARMCFERAGDVYNENWARAAGLVERAEHHISTNLGKAHTALQKAADIYETIQMYDSAASCYIKMGNYMRAGTIYLEKCGISRLEDAGDCFSMVKCWQRSADVYFQANCFSKCISICFEAELFDAGLEYLEKWRLREEKSKNEREFRGLKDIRDDYLEKCANHFYACGHLKKMMHFLRAFKSIKVIRAFLMAKRLHDELLTLELGAGNFIEAARVARLKEDLLLEACVWEKAGSFEKATRLVILDLITKSLWAHGSKGWPPKSFPKSEIHFTKAKDLARKVSTCFYNSVCSELLLWGDKSKSFPKLLNLLTEAEKSKSTKLTFLSLRFLLDLHLNHESDGYMIKEEPFLDWNKCREMMAQGWVSLNTLINIWFKWQEVASEVSLSLCEEFCLDYLGVRKEDDDVAYYVLNPNAIWISDKVRALLEKSSTGGYFMASHVYALCATSYWKREISGVSKAVVDKLDSLLRSYDKQTLSPETRGRISLLVYENIKSLKENSEDSHNFQRCVCSIEAWFWDACFPWDAKNSASQGVISIVDCAAAAELIDESLDLLLWVAHKNGKFTYGQLGKLFMVLLLSEKLPYNQFGKIMQYTQNMQWRKLFDSLFTIVGFEMVSMAVSLQKALQATYEVNWRQELDYMSPHCYLYFLDLLTFFASSCLQSAGCMITTRSVLVEIMKLRGYKIFLDPPLDQILPEARASCLGLFEFIVYSIKELLYNRKEMFDWIDKCSLPRKFYQQMVLQLAITLHMAYLNKSMDFYSAGKFLSGCGDVPRNLPWQFSNNLYRNSWDSDISLVAFVEAFASVGDPLVVISYKEDSFMFPPSNFFFFCCDELRDKSNVMSVLFPISAGPDVTPSTVSCIDHPSITVTEEVTEGTKNNQDNMEDVHLKMLEAFRCGEMRDIACIVDVFGILLSWLHQNKPTKGFYDQLIEETHRAYGYFGKNILPDKEKHPYPCLEALYSYWQDGEGKLNLIIDTLISQEASARNIEEAALFGSNIVSPTVVTKKELNEGKQQEDIFKIFEAFQQGSYQKEDLKSIHNLLGAAFSLLVERKSLLNFDEHLVEELKDTYNTFSEQLERSDGPSLEDLFSQWPHGETKLNLMIDTILNSHQKELSDEKKEASESRPDKGKLVEERVVPKTDAGSTSKHQKKKKNANKRKKNKGRNHRG